MSSTVWKENMDTCNSIRHVCNVYCNTVMMSENEEVPSFQFSIVLFTYSFVPTDRPANEYERWSVGRSVGDLPQPIKENKKQGKNFMVT